MLASYEVRRPNGIEPNTTPTHTHKDPIRLNELSSRTRLGLVWRGGVWVWGGIGPSEHGLQVLWVRFLDLVAFAR